MIFKTGLKYMPIYEDSIWLIAENNNKNVIETLKHLESLIRSTLETTPMSNSDKYPVSLILANTFILISLGYFKSWVTYEKILNLFILLVFQQYIIIKTVGTLEKK